MSVVSCKSPVNSPAVNQRHKTASAKRDWLRGAGLLEWTLVGPFSEVEGNTSLERAVRGAYMDGGQQGKQWRLLKSRFYGYLYESLYSRETI